MIRADGLTVQGRRHADAVAAYARTHGRTSTWLYARWRLGVALLLCLPAMTLLFIAVPWLLWFVLVVWAVDEAYARWPY
jgi:hypothetical protein